MSAFGDAPPDLERPGFGTPATAAQGAAPHGRPSTRPAQSRTRCPPSRERATPVRTEHPPLSAKPVPCDRGRALRPHGARSPSRSRSTEHSTSTQSNHAPSCPTSSDTPSTSPAPRSAASRAPAAPAPSTSTASRPCACLTFADPGRQRRHHDDRRPPARPPPGRVPRAPRAAVRLLHGGHAHDARTPFLKANPDPTEHEVKQALTGNLCRCTGYKPIVEAVLDR